MPLVIGLDLSLTSTGLAKVGEGSISTQTITSKGKAGDNLLSRQKRLSRLASDVVKEVIAYTPSLVLVEAPSFASAGGHHHDRSGFWWLVVADLYYLEYPVLEVPPTTLKKYATGKGNAGKDEVVIAVTRRFPDVQFKTNDEADALTAAAIGHRLLGHPIDGDMPKVNLEALKPLVLPEKP